MDNLLTLVQSILSEANSDPINSIRDTNESYQASFFVKESYEDLIYGSNEWNFTRQAIQLQASNDILAPTKMIIPDTAVKISFFQYNKKTSMGEDDSFQTVMPMENEQFFQLVNARSSSAPNVIQVNIGTGIKINCLTDQAPTYFTSFDDVNIFCDSYNAAVDDTLQQSKTQALAIIKQPWLFEDDFVPNGPYNFQSVLLNEAKARFFATLKGEKLERAELYVKSNTTRSKFLTVKSIRPKQSVRWGRP